MLHVCNAHEVCIAALLPRKKGLDVRIIYPRMLRALIITEFHFEIIRQMQKHHDQ